MCGNTAPLLLGACLYAYQVCLVGWTLFKDSWWEGQGIGKRVGSVFLARAYTHRPASRLRCVWRQAILFFIVLALYLPCYLYFLPSLSMVGTAVASSLVSVAAPVRLLMFVLPDQAKTSGNMVIAHFLILGFMTLEALMVLSRRDGRRIIDLLAGTQVLSARSTDQTQGLR